MNRYQYNYQHYEPQRWSDGGFTQGVACREKFPMDAVILNSFGEEFPLGRLNGRRFVLETASLTCPHYIANIKRMNELSRRFAHIPFIVVYVREEHPGELLASHESTEEKYDRAYFLKMRENEQREVYVDKIEGDFHRSIGSYPNIVYVVNEFGIVEFKRFWNQPNDLDIHLSGLVSCDSGGAKTTFSPGNSETLATTLRVLSNAGPSALWDHLKSKFHVWKKRERREVKSPRFFP